MMTLIPFRILLIFTLFFNYLLFFNLFIDLIVIQKAKFWQ